MVLFPYRSILAFDAASGQKAANATGQVFALDDTTFTTPLNPVDAAGVAVNLTANGDGILPTFYLDGYTSVNWKSGSWVFPLVTTEPVPGEKGDPGPAVQSATLVGDQLRFVRDDGTSTEPVTLPTGTGGSDEGVANYITTPGSATNTALSATIAEATDGLGVSNGENYGVAIGDSIVFGWNGNATVEPNVDPWPRLVNRINPAITLVNKGISGNTMQQVRDRYDADVTALNPGMVHIAIGTNNLWQYTLADMKGFATEIAEKAKAAGHKVYWHTILPRTGADQTNAEWDERIRIYNRWLGTTLCPAYGFRMVDTYTVFTNTDGTVKAGYLPDGRHPSVKGYWEYAKKIASVLAAPQELPYVWPGEKNAIADPLFTGASTNGVINSLIHTNSAGVTVTGLQLVARAAGLGNWQQSTRAGGATTSDHDSFNTGWEPITDVGAVAGDTLEVALDLDVVTGQLYGDNFRILVQMAHNVSGAASEIVIDSSTENRIYSPVQDVRLRTKVLIPALATHARIFINCYGRAVEPVTWRIGRLSMVKFTA